MALEGDGLSPTRAGEGVNRSVLLLRRLFKKGVLGGEKPLSPSNVRLIYGSDVKGMECENLTYEVLKVLGCD